MKSDINEKDEIEIVDENNGLWARIRIREGTDKRTVCKASIFLTPAQLVDFAHDLLALAINMRERR